MLILISDISKLDSQTIDYEFLNKIPSYRLRSKNGSDIQRSINSLKLLKAGLYKFGIDLLKEDLVYNEFGKPNLKRKGIFYSISHSGKYITCAISNKTVGIDIQQHVEKFEEIIYFFSPSEKKYLASISLHKILIKEFFKIWTVKESYVKFLGKGLYKELDSFSLFLDKKKIIERNRVVEGILYKNFSISEEYTMSIVASSDDNYEIRYVDIKNLICL
ncbi:4'-phosphopantetheinyl transferase superfamily protein [Streptococcus mutans]|uniref:4'-phosphopantetheinyl transferase family protein n=1 Tax=Streptococcus mutans TaxID=1309 RepID=UPI0002B5AE82|nr:4'-phosphopantetheinyl transferase superfamily protein [Streptococcus mutans]EMB87565.1 putative phosphopantetheinyl transferase [Streptococcus mutans N29]EMB89596.1 putative phosphopantetheinyl transferase [Streptococcus mutans NMT4863]MCB4978177.1 4'-phosphopantetheinyl transferase superfamily protein [Streptococcus mutans]MCB5051389.1 4'-phosphopantetheinyl transferase superfamily protein [Streptococcus mutans]MDB8630825.1 4'-phosphopantetheinyl transferase superfamily protein [Streptoco